MPKAIAKLRYLKIAPRKTRSVANLLKGMTISQAEAQLSQVHRRASGPIRKLLASVVANAEKTEPGSKSSLYISKITVDPGPTLKRHLPRARGSVSPIHKRTSHITIELSARSGGKKEEFKEAHAAHKHSTASIKNVGKENKDTGIGKTEDFFGGKEELSGHSKPEKPHRERERQKNISKFPVNPARKFFQRKAI